jgi:hypothetical protein
MANFTVSPGVTTNELDHTFLTGQPVQAGAAIIGPTVKGPYEVPTLVTSYLQYTSLFGDSFVSGGVNYSYLTSIAAYNYFNYGGSSLLVARVASGSFTAATSSIIENNVTSVSGLVASSSFDVSTIITGSATASYAGIRIEIPGENDYYVAPNPFFTSFNNITDIYYSSSGATTNDNFDNYMAVVVSTINNSSTEFPTVGLTASYNAGSNIFTLSAINPGDELNGINIYKEAYTGQIGTLVGTLSGGTANIGSNSFTLETLSEGIVNNSTSPEISGVLSSGSKDNLRWEITNLNTGSGTFNVLIRQGNDTPNNKLILESFNNVSLDPNSNRFISLVIGDQKLDYNSTNNQMELTGNYKNISKYVRVKSITDLTPNYLDPNGTISDAAFSTYLPLNQTGSFGNATGTVAANVGTTMYENIGATTQGLVDTDYTNMVALLGNREAYQFNVLFTPGITNNQHPGVVSNIISNTQNRGDNFYVLDLIDYNGTVASISK